MHRVVFSSLLISVTFASAMCQIHFPMPDPPVLRAVAALTTGNIQGVIQFIKENPYAQVQVHGNVTGLSPGRHGFHVHRFGDLTGGCKSAAAHYNPANADHGAPSDDIRHIGDLGNIEADVNGVALFSFYDRLLALEGPQNIIGRAVVRCDTQRKIISLVQSELLRANENMESSTLLYNQREAATRRKK